VDTLKESGSKIIVLLGYNADIMNLMREAKKKEMISSHYVYVGVNAMLGKQFNY
jgi:hypothetical protein